jgi:hypothetical protein
LNEVGGTATLTSSEGQGTLTLHSFWLPGSHPSNLEEVLHLEELFARQRNVRTLRPPANEYEAVALAGEGVVGGGARWWQTLFVRQQWCHFRAWAFRHQSVYVVAIYLQTGPRDPELETLAGMVVDTLEFAEQPAEPPEVFSQRVVDLARAKFPLLKCELNEGFQLRLGESNVNLFNFYRSYVNAPEKFDAIVLPALTTVVQVQDWGDNQTEPSFEHVRNRILPMLYPLQAWRDSFPNFIGEPWVADLIILYVVDESNAYWYIREDLLETWNLSREALHDLALENLDVYFSRHSMEFTLVGEEHGPKVLMPNRPDAYNTSRLLSREFHVKLRKLLGREFAVGIPNRDFFVAVNLESSDAVAQIRHKVSEDFAQMDHPLTDRLLLISNDGVSEYVDE